MGLSGRDGLCGIKCTHTLFSKIIDRLIGSENVGGEGMVEDWYLKRYFARLILKERKEDLRSQKGFLFGSC